MSGSKFYKEFKADLLLMPVATVLVFVCLTLPLSLPFVIIYPLMIAAMLFYRAKKCFLELEISGSYTTTEANRSLDTSVFSLFLLLFVVPLSVFNYFASVVALENGGIYREWLQYSMGSNEYFLNILLDRHLLKIFLSEEVYEFLLNPIRHSVLYPLSISIFTTSIVFVASLPIARFIIPSWERRIEDKKRLSSKPKQTALFRSLILGCVIFLLVQGFFILRVKTQFHENSMEFLDFFKMLLLYLGTPFISFYCIQLIIGNFLKLIK